MSDLGNRYYCHICGCYFRGYGMVLECPVCKSRYIKIVAEDVRID